MENERNILKYLVSNDKGRMESEAGKNLYSILKKYLCVPKLKKKEQKLNEINQRQQRYAENKMNLFHCSELPYRICSPLLCTANNGKSFNDKKRY